MNRYEEAIEVAWSYFWKYCPDPRAYFEDWTDEEMEEMWKQRAAS